MACPAWIYSNGHPVENVWARLKEQCAVATWSERPFDLFLCLTATVDWIEL